jgi:putative transposase
MSKRTPKTAGYQDSVSSIFEGLSPWEIQDHFKERAKAAALSFGLELLEAETSALCGARYGREGECYRHGKERTTLTLGAARYPVERPRIRSGDGSREVYPESLAKLRRVDLLDAEMHKRMLRGASTRNYEGVIEGYSDKIGISKSSVSRAFIRSSQKELDAINGDSLSAHEFVALIVDGIEIDGTTVIAALGVTKELHKIPLGLKEGSTENAQVVTDLLASVIERDFKLYGERLVCVLDGAKALRKAVKSVFGSRAIIQRCWLHKLRNIMGYMPSNTHAELRGRIKKIMGLVTLALAQVAYKQLRKWLLSFSHDAAQSLDEAGDELLQLHALGVTGELRKCLTTTNAIESLFSVVRRKCKRVKNWNSTNTNQKMRWVAAAIKEHQQDGMRKMRGKNQISALLKQLSKRDTLDQTKKAA